MLNPSRRRRAEEENGFTLIELLVVILIVGILAAIAVPAFLNQNAKASDASAKSNVRTAQTAEETYAADNNGAYTDEVASSTDNGPLASIEPSLKQAPFVTVKADSTGYTITGVSTGSDGDTFVLTSSNGIVTRTCSGSGTGCTNSSW